MAIEIGKILGISDKKYFDLIGDKSPDYLYVDVNIKVDTTFRAREIFAETIPNSAEVVVSYREKAKGYFHPCISISGTALISKLILEEHLKDKWEK